MRGETIGAWLEHPQRAYRGNLFLRALRRLEKLRALRLRRRCSLVASRFPSIKGHIRLGRWRFTWNLRYVRPWGIVRVKVGLE